MFAIGAPPLQEVPEPETATEESKSIQKTLQTHAVSFENVAGWSSAKVQSQDATTACFAREDPLAPITNV